MGGQNIFKKLFFLFSVFSIIVYAQENPIDKRLNDCLEKNQTTIGMSECLTIAINEWDKELNDNYKKVMALLDKPKQEKLKEAQRNWIAFRQSNDQRIIDMLTAEEGYGTIVQIQIPDMKMTTIKSRALELKIYYDYLTSGEFISGFTEQLDSLDSLAAVLLSKCKSKSDEEECIRILTKKYDNELNICYKKAKDDLPVTVQKKLLEAQRLWIKYQQNSDLFINSLSADTNNKLLFKLETIRHRAGEMRDYYFAKHME